MKRRYRKRYFPKLDPVCSANALNQYTSRDVPGYLNVMGVAHASASPTVNGNSPYRKGEFFRHELSVNNSSAAQWQAVTNIASLTGTNQTNTGNLFLPKTAESYTYDADGNLTSDGRWTNRWDAENRLIDMTSHASGPSGSRKSLQFAYDLQNRRYSKVVSNWTGSAWSRVLDERFIYEGWDLVATLNGTNAAIIRSFMWGLDLSGSLQGAGGVGGLICFRQHSGPQAGTHFAAFDGNGNVIGLLDSGGALSARYEYPFGQTVRASGSAAAINIVRFSSKCVDEESDFSYYGYRYLSNGRWLSRDAIEETDSVNLFAFVRQNSTSRIDPLGLELFDLGSKPMLLGPLRDMKPPNPDRYGTTRVEVKPRGQDVVRGDSCGHCAHVEDSVQVDVTVVSYIGLDGMMTLWTPRFAGAMLAHENKHRKIVTDGYNAYFKPYNETIPKQCGVVCRKTPGEAASLCRRSIQTDPPAVESN